MAPALLWLAACLCAAGAALALTLAVPRALGSRTREIVRVREARRQQDLEELFIRGVSARQVEGMAAVGAGVLGLVVGLSTGSLVLALGCGAVALFAPRVVFESLRRRRLEKFDEQLPDALSVLANSTRAGMSLTQALEQVAVRSAPPVSEEMGFILQELRLGTDLGRSIENARQRIGSRPFALVATSLQVNRDKGGNLPEALDTMAHSLKEIWRLEQRLITASAEGRKAAWLISGMPAVIFLMVALFQPDIARTLVANVAGFALLLVALVFYGSGLFWLRRVLRVEP